MRMRAPSRAHRPLAALGLITAATLAGAGAASASTPPTTDPTTTADASTTTDAATATTAAATPTTGGATPTGPIPPGPLCAALGSTAATGDVTTSTMVTDATSGTAADATLTTDATLTVPTAAGGSATGTADLESIELLSTFATALDDTGVSAALTSGESYTILAPINSAFDKINLTLPTETTGLDATLNMHILPGDFDAQELVDAGNVVSLSGDPVTFEVRNDTLVINDGDAAALCTEVPGTDVSLILIDTVLEPGTALDATTSSDTTATTADATATTAATTLGTTPDLGTVSSTTGG